MTATPHKGDKVKWSSSAGETTGKVEKVVTSTTKIAGHTAKATKDEPQVVVKSEKTGKKAVHKPEALKKA
ncbi:DUF2945 domain-containing protein [Acetobacteraceae bacterium KSS8]|uniref:DUF2945 domain-containing protein n=1 Tax=Endosaccharibacter trunci TaxID=2812733 RepID=A0ABT1W657_9PROT|nr:DUF2945 domain-containing protein [Acetobacteraceae bacterium KSS8]